MALPLPFCARSGLVLAVALVLGSACLEPAGGDGDAEHGGQTGDDAWSGGGEGGGGWPPDGITPDKQTRTVGEAGGTLTWFGGVVRLVVPPGAVPAETEIDCSFEVVMVGDVPLVGYVWGPHGMPLDPPAELVIEVPADFAPPHLDDARDAGLYLVTGELLTPVQGLETTLDGGNLVLRGKLDSLGTLAIGPVPDPVTQELP